MIESIISSRYGDRIELIKGALLISKELARDISGERSTSEQLVVGEIFKRMYNSISSSIVLIEQGYGMQASIIVRSLVEDYININYVISDQNDGPHVIAQRYLDYTKAVGAIYKAKVFDQLGETLDTATEQVIQDALDEYTRNHPGITLASLKKNGWSGFGADVRAQRAGGKVSTVYRTMFSLFSGVTHGSPELTVDPINDLNFFMEFGPADEEQYIVPVIWAMEMFSTELPKIVGTFFGKQSHVDNADKMGQVFASYGSKQQ